MSGLDLYGTQKQRARRSTNHYFDQCHWRDCPAPHLRSYIQRKEQTFSKYREAFMDVSSQPGILILAGGGHTHALMLKKWIHEPELKPNDLIILVSNSSTTLYSGMAPGLIASVYEIDDLQINIRQLCDQAKISFIKGEIVGLDTNKQQLLLAGRPPLPFTRLSINLGSTTTPSDSENLLHKSIKPLKRALQWLEAQDIGAQQDTPQPFTIIGSGLAAIETSLALRKRWRNRPLQLQAKRGSKTIQPFLNELKKADITLLSDSQSVNGPALRCTGSRPPAWLSQSGLPLNSEGRIQTDRSLQVLSHPNFFATGDCAVIKDEPRPASGVWAVRAAPILATNIQRQRQKKALLQWKPQRHALQLVGGFNAAGEPMAWALRNGWCFGPSQLLWRWKQTIDRRFMAMFQMQPMAEGNRDMACRGCAAKLPAQSLENALTQAGFGLYGEEPEDAVQLDRHWSQSVDGFPALINDPWLNARITTLHACSDLWACGQRVHSAQMVITLPEIPSQQQEWLMSQTLQGAQSALHPQNAQLLGGHTLVARDQSPSTPAAGLQLALIVNGKRNFENRFWSKRGLEPGDALLLSRSLGSGVLLAAAMAGATQPEHFDQALEQMATSQHDLLEQLLAYEEHQPSCIHACTDITGFGLLGHLGEMLRGNQAEVSVHLQPDSIPSLPGSLQLLADGYCSTLAPSNRRAWALLDSHGDHPAKVSLSPSGSHSHDQQAILELLVDPQTCGPLLVSCSQSAAKELCQQGPWANIGEVIKLKA